nr:zinc finger BED domain-containing protein RICESLEEPER 2-like [Ipomoea batatas]
MVVVVVLGFLVLVSRFSAAASREWVAGCVLVCDCACVVRGVLLWVGFGGLGVCTISLNVLCLLYGYVFSHMVAWVYIYVLSVCQMFFPILRSEHYFLVCFDFRRFWMEVIDNNPSPVATKNKYGESLIDMCCVLGPGVMPKRMQMHWRDFKIMTDCGVYLMRHMETFMGQGVSDWECGLVKGDSGMLNKFRLQYMKDLVLSEYNLHRTSNLARAYHSVTAPVGSL